MLYVFCHNHTVDVSIGDGTRSPYMISTGRDDGISNLLCFRFNEPVYCLVNSKQQKFPSEFKEVRARWVGISEVIGGPMTWKVITKKTIKFYVVPTFDLPSIYANKTLAWIRLRPLTSNWKNHPLTVHRPMSLTTPMIKSFTSVITGRRTLHQKLLEINTNQ